MVKHELQQLTNSLSVFDHFVDLALTGLILSESKVNKLTSVPPEIIRKPYVF